MAEQVQQRHPIQRCLLRDALIPLLDTGEHLRALSAGLVGESRQACQVRYVSHDYKGAGSCVQLREQRIQVLQIVLVGDAADEVVDDQPDGNQVRRVREGQWQFLAQRLVQADATDAKIQ